jgi:hypothetical protein
MSVFRNFTRVKAIVAPDLLLGKFFYKGSVRTEPMVTPQQLREMVGKKIDRKRERVEVRRGLISKLQGTDQTTRGIIAKVQGVSARHAVQSKIKLGRFR